MKSSFPALVYAAGLGTRMGALTKSKPKPLIKVAKQTLLDHAFDVLDSPRISKKVVNVHYCADQIKAHISDRNVAFSDESRGLLETGGGLRKAIPLLNSNPVVTLNSDAIWKGPPPLNSLLNAWQDEFQSLLLLVPVTRAYGHKGSGDFNIDENNRISRGTNFIYTGLQITKTELFEAVPVAKFTSNIVWDQMIETSGMFGVVYEGSWCDVGQPESIPIAEALLESTNADV